MIHPVLTGGQQRTLRQNMPHMDEGAWQRANKDRYAILELVGRTLCGIAPWLERQQNDPEEEKLRLQYAALARDTIDDITDPSSPDYERFFVPMEENGNNPFIQSLVDAAFLSHAILRAPTELYEKLDSRVKDNLIRCLKDSRRCRPPHNNWLLFSGMVEAALCCIGEEPDLMRVDYCLAQHEQWYKGDGVYGDGAAFHWDYYNSYVIQPMMVDIARTFAPYFPENGYGQKRIEMTVSRATRYAAILERMIAPDGTFTVIGRSIAYRTGAFQLLAQAALQGMLPPAVSPAQVRSALTAVIHRCFDGEANFDGNGWLYIGLCGNQPGLGEGYICTGSLYLCTTGFLPLGLPEDDPFWDSEHEDWTSRKIWSGADMPADHSVG
ncbi:MAG: DUF2264 domain-containing protein [Clostridia bacterium]|nr:DUF2264 domain-containing protein [Clostridia bacterium]